MPSLFIVYNVTIFLLYPCITTLLSVYVTRSARFPPLRPNLHKWSTKDWGNNINNRKLKCRDFSRWDFRLRLEETPHYDSTLLDANSLISLDNVLSTFHFSDSNRLVRRWLVLQRPEHKLCVITSQWIWWTGQFVPDLQWNVSLTYTIIILSFFRVRFPWIYIRNELRYISSPCMLEWVAVGFPP